MQIFSRDQWFINGFQQILNQSVIERKDEMIIFDSGVGQIYITNKAELLRVFTADSLTQFTEVRCYSLMKNAHLDEYFHVLEQAEKNKKYPLHAKLLSEREKLVIQHYMSGFGQREIAQAMALSERAISGSKLRALRKMNVKSIQLFLLVMRNWREFVAGLSHC